jgi:cyclin-dependent kinase 8/11
MAGGIGKGKPKIQDKYQILGFISSGTYGMVYKAKGKEPNTGIYAIKRYDLYFKRLESLNC